MMGVLKALFTSLVCTAGGGNSIRRYQACNDGTCELVEVSPNAHQ